MVQPLLVRAAVRHRRAAVTAAGLHVAAVATYLLQAVVLALGLAAAVEGDQRGVLLALGGVLLIVAVRAWLTWVQARAASRLGTAVRASLRDEALAGTLVPSALHDPRRRDGALRATLVDGVDGVDAYVTRYLPAVLEVLVMVPVVSVLLTLVHPVAGLVAGCAAIAAVLVPTVWKRALARRSWGHWDTYEGLGSDLLESLRGMTTLRLLGTVPSARARLVERSDALHAATVRVMRVSLADTALIDLAVQAGAVAAVGLAVADAATGQGAATSSYLVLLLAGEVFRPVRDLSRAWHAGYLGTSAVGALAALGVGADPPVTRDPGARTPDDTDRAAPLVLEDLTFTYPGSEHPVLAGTSAVLEVGQIIAVVGPSGVGKSTLLDLVLGHLRPDGGRVHRAGEEPRLKDVAVVTQRPVLFEGTVRENLRVGRPAADDAELLRACAAAGVLEEVRAMPGGLDAHIATSGITVSGGQRQRLALARAIVADRPVLLADEPTSALDTEAARAVTRTLAKLAQDRIVVVVAHREESLEGVDRVLVLSDGQLREREGVAR